MKFATSFAAVTMASLLCAGASLASSRRLPGLTEGADQAMPAHRRMAPAAALAALVIAPATNEWLTWGYDQERTGWNRAETTLTAKNVAQAEAAVVHPAGRADRQICAVHHDRAGDGGGVATPSGPNDLLFILGGNDTLFAVDADSGKQLWEKSFPNPHKPKKPKEWLCPGTANDTPTIDKARGIVFFITGDGKLRGLNLADGAERLAPVAMTAPFARAWSLNLIDNVLYSTSGRACGEVTDKSSLEYAAAISGLRRAGTGPLLDASAAECGRCQRPGASGGHPFLHQRRASGRALGPRRRGARARRRDAGNQRRPL